MSRRKKSVRSPVSSNVSIFFCKHLWNDTAKKFLTVVAQVDALVLEFNMQDDRIADYERDFNELAAGFLTVESMITKYPGGDHELFRLLHECRKQVILERSPVTIRDLNEYVQLDKMASLMKAKLDLVGAVNFKLKALRRFAEINNRRDVDLAAMIKELIAKAPERRILIYRGLAHQRKLTAELCSRSIKVEPIVAGNSTMDVESALIERLANGESVSTAEILGVIR